MKPANVTTVVKQFKRLFSERELNKLGKSSRFCQRERAVTPWRLVLGLIQVLSHANVRTIADIQRGFNALCATSVRYKPFHNQLAKPGFPAFMRAICERLMSEVAGKSLCFDKESPFSRFSRIILHDGSSFAVKADIQSSFPGRFSATNPAAVELHVTLELLSESLQQVVLTPDTEAETIHAPQPQSLQGGLLLADRMFFVKQYLADIEQAGGHYLVKARGSLNPVIRCARRADGRIIRSWAGKRLDEVKGRFSRHACFDLDVEWGKPGALLKSRLLVSWDAENRRPRYLVTNLDRESFTTQQVFDAYRLRWQIELLFKEWKSHANLRSYDTTKPNIAEGLIWASLCTAILKRYLAHTTQWLKHLPISTRKVAMCLHHVLPSILAALMHQPRRLRFAIEHALNYLANNATRAHPKRDRKTGRLKLGLEHVFEGLKD